MGSQTLLSIGSGWLPLVAALRVLLDHRLELFGELVVLFQCKLHPATMLALHLLRQLGWASVLHRMDLPGTAILKRCVHNYCFMMVVSCVLELRLWALSRQDKAVAQSPQTPPMSAGETLPCKAKVAAGMYGVPSQYGASEGAYRSGKSTMTDAQQRRLSRAYDSACSSDAAASAAGAAGPDCGECETPTCNPVMNNTTLLELLMTATHAWGVGPGECVAPVPAGHVAPRVPQIPPAQPLPRTGAAADVTGVPQPAAGISHAGGAASFQPPRSTPVAAGSAGWGLLQPAAAWARPSDLAVVRPVGAALPGSAPRARPGLSTRPQPGANTRRAGTESASRAALTAVPGVAAGSPVFSYPPSLMRTPCTVYIKLKDMDVCDLPHDFQHCFKQQLRRCMSGLAVAGVAVRSGCVMLVIDLHAMGGGSGSIADAILVECLSEAVQEMTADIGVNRFTVQVNHALYTCERASASDPFRLSLASSPAPVPADTSALALRSVAPVVHCVGSTQPLTAQVKLELPRGCHLLEQWKPPGPPHGSDAGSVHVGGQAKLLVRAARGDYLPVRAEVVCVEATDAMTTLHTVKVHVDLPPTSALCPMGLSLELWYTPATASMSTGPTELLAAHVPMLALPHVCQDAASELAQIVPQLASVPVLQDVGGDMHTRSGQHTRPVRDSAEHVYNSILDTAQDMCNAWGEEAGGTSAMQRRGTMYDSADVAAQQLDSSNMAELVEDMGVFFNVHGPAWVAKQHGPGISHTTDSSTNDADMSQALLAYMEGTGMTYTTRLLRGMLRCSQNEQEQGVSAVVQAPCADSHTSAAGPSSAPAPLPTTPAHPTTPHTPWPVLSWLAHVRDMLATTADPDYQTWTMKQMRGFLPLSVLVVAAIGSVCLARSYLAGGRVQETLGMAAHVAGRTSYGLIGRLCGDRLICYQMWPVLPDSMAYVLASVLIHLTPQHLLVTWRMIISHHLDTLYFSFMCPSIVMPTPLPVLFLTRIAVAYFQCLAIRAAGAPHPVMRSLLVQSAAMATTVAYRLRQVHLYRRACEARRKAKEE